MIEKIIEWSIRNKLLVILATIITLALGIIVIKKTPVDALPDLSDVQVIIKTPFPGQAPQVVEDQVTYPLATAMLAVPKAVTVRAYSFFGDSYVYVLFKDGTDPYWARSRVLEYLSQVSSKLPPEAKPELGPDATGVGWVYEYALKDTTNKLNLSELTTLQNWFLKYELQTVPGVSEVATIGGMVKQYQVIVSPNKLRAFNITLSHVAMSIKKANQEVGGSVIEMGEAEYMVRARGYLQKTEDFKHIPLSTTKTGTPITLSDVATIRLGPEMRRGVAELNGQGETVGGIIVMRQGENSLEVINAVKKKLKELQSSLPQGVKIVTTYDRSSLIKRAIHNLQWTLVEECSIVILLCFLFLFHFRSSLIVLFTLPLGVIGAFILMYFTGKNANIMSLGGIAIAIGAMVDASIVMIENAHKHFEHNPNKERWQVILDASKEVGPSLFFSLLIISLSFLPVFTLEAQEGRLFSPLAFTKTYAMAFSAFLSITLVPVLMGYFIRGKILPEKRNPLNRVLIRTYRPLINWTLKHPWKIVFFTLTAVILSIYPYQKLGSEFMPELDEGDILYMPTMLPGISIGKARQILQQTDKLIKTIPEVKSVFGKVGRAQTATDPAPLTMIETVVQLKEKAKWRKGMTTQRLKMELSHLIHFPGVTNAWVMPIKSRIDMLATGIKTPVGIKVSGPSLKKIQEIGEDLEKILRNVPGTTSVYADRAVGGRYVDVSIKRLEASRYGMNIAEIHKIVSTAVGGISISQTIEGRERYPINLRYPQLWRNSANKLKNLPLVTPTGANIVLSDIASVKIVDGPPAIKSEDARLTGWVLVDINNVDLGSYVKNAMQVVKQKLKLPSGYSLSWSGQYEYMERAKAKLHYVLPFTLVIIILMLYLNFNSFFEVGVILLTLPLSLVGSIWFLYFLDYNLSIAVAVGMIALAGVAVEIGVVMLLYLNQALKHELKTGPLTKMKLTNAIIEGALMRVRPIIMTVISTVIALIPIMLGTGTGSAVMRRIAAPMVGGMLSATILALLLIPAIFYLWYNRSVENVS